MLYEFIKYPATGWIRARQKRVSDSNERNEQAEKSWNENPDIQKAQFLKDQNQLDDLAKYGLGSPDVDSDIDFDPTFLEAEEEISKKLGKNWNEEKIDNSETFEAEILGTSDVLVSENFELSEEDNKGFENLLKILKEGKDLKTIPLNIKTINLSA